MRCIAIDMPGYGKSGGEVAKYWTSTVTEEGGPLTIIQLVM